MTPRKKFPPIAVLRSIFSYDPISGVLFSKKTNPPSPVHFWKGQGCLRVGINGSPYALHRLVWKLVHGTVPALIDHKNGDFRDNRLCNLRVATYKNNNWNRKRRTGKKLPKWVMYDGNYPGRRKKYKAVVVVNGKANHLGRFHTPDEAHAAACALAKKLHGQFYRAA